MLFQYCIAYDFFVRQKNQVVDLQPIFSSDVLNLPIV